MKYWWGLLALWISGIALAVVSPSHPQIKTTNSLLSPTMHKKLKRIQVLLDEKAYGEAIQEISKLEDVYKERRGDYAKISQYKGYVLAQKEDYLGAVEAFVAAVESGGLNESEAIQSLELSGQLYMSLEQYPKAASVFESVKLHKKNLSPNILAAMAITYAQLQDTTEALKNITAAIQQVEKPNRNWLELQVALYFEAQQFAEAARVLEQLITLAPTEKKYWSQLVSASLSQERDIVGLAALKNMTLVATNVEERDWLNKVQMQLSVGEPYFAASQLEQYLAEKKVRASKKIYQFLAQCWSAARENDKALAAYDQAAKLDDSGKVDLLRAQLLLENEFYDRAESALNAALEKLQDQEDKGQARLLLGITMLQKQNFPAAEKNLVAAMRMDKFAKQAQAWMNYMQR